MDNQTPTAPQHDPRHVSRALALQQVFSELIAHRETVPTEILLEELESEKFEADLLTQIVEGTKEHVAAIDPVIAILAPAWPIDQIAPVDLTLLRMGIWEAFIGEITPVKVVINEMIELAKQFGGVNSSAFVNGVLGTLVNREELQTQARGGAPSKRVAEESDTASNSKETTNDTTTDTQPDSNGGTAAA